MMYLIVTNRSDEYSTMYIHRHKPIFTDIPSRGCGIAVTWEEVLNLYKYQSYRFDDESKRMIEGMIIEDYLKGKSFATATRKKTHLRMTPKKATAWTYRIAWNHVIFMSEARLNVTIRARARH